jgi:hypothetical protein
MTTRFRYRPSRALSAFASVVGAAMLVFGIVMMSRKTGFHPFELLWVLVLLGIIVFHLINVFSKRGIGFGVIESMTDTSIDERLTQLEALRTKGLVTQQEYEHKRRELLAEI